MQRPPAQAQAQQMQVHLVIAPHGDDEIIGCYGLLREVRLYNEVAAIYYPNGIGSDPGPERVSKMFNVTIFDTQSEYTKWLSGVRTDVCFHAPDPYFEHHPSHKRYGAFAEQVFREGGIESLYFYSTRMDTPYYFEVPDPEEKRQALNVCYPEKRSLWEYDHRYFLFESSVQIHKPW
jgi:LmbE family N-acetylglucosaminyl deacetylase